MLEKKTTEEIFIENSLIPIKNTNELPLLKIKNNYKVWVGQESLIKMFLDDKKCSNDIDMKNYIDDVINSLKGEKE